MKIILIMRNRVRGFTLVELLLTMMAMLLVGSFIWKTATVTIGWANNSRMSIEISQLSRALEDFHTQFGDYPPDFHDQMLVWNFLKAKFPKCPHEKYPCFAEHSPASALYFWLAGPEGNGFSSDPTDPFDPKGKRRIGPFYRFDKQRLKAVGDAMHFYPPRSKDGNDPYVYFRPEKKSYLGHPGWGQARPYRSTVTQDWIAPEGFQIICPGNDGTLGSGFHYPGGTDYDAANMDDITSFSEGKTLQKQIPQIIPTKPDKDEDEKLPLE
jgi:type II secretory pathway pseudopilin PulG